MHRTNRSLDACVLAVLCGALLVAPPAYAQSSDAEKITAAQALYDEAVVAMDAGDHATACPKLAEAVRLVPEGIGAKLTLAECYEKTGKLASAWSQYAVAKSLAERAGQKDRATRAAAKAEALKGRLARLTIEVPKEVGAIPQLSVTRGGVVVGEGQWGMALPVDVGNHEIVVTAPGYQAWTRTVELAKDGDTVVVRVEAPPIAPTARAAEERRRAASTVVIQNFTAARPWQRPLGIAAMGAGAAGLVVGAVLGGLAIQKNDESNAGGLCDADDYCKRAGLVLRSEAVGLGNGSTAALAIGGVVLLGGVVLFATAPAPSPKGKAPRGAFVGAFTTVELLPAGLRVRGAF
ncbi:PEGA domain-containing protein [Polyangium mundeleinium]|uniref:PEGA domain-containing protein n=1 Tax=Polyangium mundeleinium TaxID=2995306 RepID=A0ABT5EZZ4_9BACT|nr:PEGA domain-containing protein [Polyangium mundeleinium]MDC0747407.1 PEGA domain-containing protein [Polyangium mundeleinium]